MTPETLKFKNDIDAMERLIPLARRRVVHIGCGDGGLAFELAKRGATVLGINSDPVQARINRALGGFAQVTLVEGFPQNLPQNDGTVDCVIFANYLSQIDARDMDECLGEACRILKEVDGFLYVLEKDSSGLYDGILRMFDDQSAVRAWAGDALLRMPQNFFASAREIHYSVKQEFSSFDAFFDKCMAKKAINYGAADVNDEDVRAYFEQGCKGAGYEFEQEMRVSLYRSGPVAPGVPGAAAAPASVGS